MAVTQRNFASSGSSPVTITATTAGSTLVVSPAGHTSQMTVSSVTASGCTFTQISGVYIFDAGTNFAGDMWIATNVPANVTSVTVNLSAGSIDHIDIYELTPAILDSIGTSAFNASTTVGITIPNTNAGAQLIECTVCTGAGTLSGTGWTQDAATGGNPCGHKNPGDTVGYAPTLANSGYLMWGASFKDANTVLNPTTGSISIDGNLVPWIKQSDDTLKPAYLGQWDPSFRAEGWF